MSLELKKKKKEEEEKKLTTVLHAVSILTAQMASISPQLYSYSTNASKVQTNQHTC
jgi:hypothetical protein